MIKSTGWPTIVIALFVIRCSSVIEFGTPPPRFEIIDRPVGLNNKGGYFTA
jgi:hypothetical protein